LSKSLRKISRFGQTRREPLEPNHSAQKRVQEEQIVEGGARWGISVGGGSGRACNLAYPNRPCSDPGLQVKRLASQLGDFHCNSIAGSGASGNAWRPHDRSEPCVWKKSALDASQSCRNSHHRHLQDQGGVLNPETKAWEMQDPDYDSYWTSLPSRARVSLAETADNLDAPCGRSSCGWEPCQPRRQQSEVTYPLDILSVTSKERDVRYSVYTPRANVERVG
jgi:hypothetical protein